MLKPVADVVGVFLVTDKPLAPPLGGCVVNKMNINGIEIQNKDGEFEWIANLIAKLGHDNFIHEFEAAIHKNRGDVTFMKLGWSFPIRFTRTGERKFLLITPF